MIFILPEIDLMDFMVNEKDFAVYKATDTNSPSYQKKSNRKCTRLTVHYTLEK